MKEVFRFRGEQTGRGENETIDEQSGREHEIDANINKLEHLSGSSPLEARKLFDEIFDDSSLDYAYRRMDEIDEELKGSIPSHCSEDEQREILSLCDEYRARAIEAYFRNSPEFDEDLFERLFLENTPGWNWVTDEKILQERCSDENGFRSIDHFVIDNLYEGGREKYFVSSRIKLMEIVAEKMADKKRAVDLMVKWLAADAKSYSLRERIADLLNKLDPEYAKSVLVKVRDAAGESFLGDLAVNLLYRLELGNLPIGEDGLEYLGVPYDLENYNGGGNIAHRLTADGKVGVFDREKRLAKYFQAERQKTGNVRVTPELSELHADDIFFPKAGETEADEKGKAAALDEFKDEYLAFFTTKFFEDTGCYISDMTLHEQGALINCLRENEILKDENKYRDFCYFVRFNGIGKLRSLLITEHNPKLYLRLLEINKDHRSIGTSIFEKVAAIMVAAGMAKEYLSRIYGQDADRQAYAGTVHNMMAKAIALLEREDIFDIEPEYFELIKADILLFAAAYKEVSKEKSIDLDQVEKVGIETMGAKEISPDEREKMKEIFVGNRKQYSPELLQKTSEEFEQSLEGKGKFYVLRHDADIIGYLRFENRADDRSYAGSFNISPEIKGFAIGSALLRQAIEREGQTKTIEAVVYEKNPMLKHYTGDFGFKIVGEIADYEGTGEKFYKIERPPTLVRPRAELRAAA